MRHIFTRCLGFFLFMFPAPASAWDGDKSLRVNDSAKDFTLPLARGGTLTLSEALAEGPVVLSFYRGGWCPVCNMQLRSFQEILPKIEAQGAQLIAVSPETPDNAELTMVETELTFPVLSDEGNKVARNYGILWEVPEGDREGFAKWLKETTGRTLPDYNDQDGYELPVPATFVIAQDGTIVYAFVDPDYRNRADNADVLKALRGLQD